MNVFLLRTLLLLLSLGNDVAIITFNFDEGGTRPLISVESQLFQVISIKLKLQ